jgi:hypothetical protein
MMRRRKRPRLFQPGRDDHESVASSLGVVVVDNVEDAATPSTNQLIQFQ